MNDVNRKVRPVSPTPAAEIAPAATTAPTEDSAVERRRKLRLPLMIGGAALILGVALIYYFMHRRYESTDDAYVNAARIAISSNVAGRVTAVEVLDNQRVRKGDVLFRIDDRPFQLAVAEAQARLDKSILDVDALKATYRQKQSELRSASDTFKYEQRESERQQKLLSSGISSQAQVDRAMHARDAASQAISAAQQQLANALASLGGNPDIDSRTHPAVEQAQAMLDRAKLDLSYTVISAPDEGVVTQVERLHAGDYVNSASPLFALIATHDLWVEANFKESQLSRMRPGQPVVVVIDAYGGREFKGHIVSFSPGTGAQFAMLPAQNATGNWVKVVQRLPVRIEIDDADADHPLYAGLSANVKVDTRG